MRKLLFVAAFLACALDVCGASQRDTTDVFPDYDLRIGVGTLPEVAMDNLQRYGYDYYYDTQGTLSRIYQDYNGPATSTNAISAELVLKLKERWSIGIVGAVNILWCDRFRGTTDEKYDTKVSAVLYLVPTVKFFYMRSPLIRLYGSAGFGVEKYIGFDSMKYSYKDEYGMHYVNDSVQPSATFSPFGMEVGRKLYGFFEVGVSTMYTGLNFGVGYKF